MKPEARWWNREGDSVRCLLCPHQCLIADGKRGLCGIRGASSGLMVLPGYGRITGEALDPIEKKPLYHFHPGKPVWSVGFTGCNLICPFCQNHHISRAVPERGTYRSPEDLIAGAAGSGSGMVAYTYSEPSIHTEYLLDCARLARESGLKNVLVTNGNLNPDAAEELLNTMDGVNIDFKSWNPEYYRKVLKGDLETVKEFFDIARKTCWVEITTLVVPGDNDNRREFTEMVSWLASRSIDIPLHLSAYYPAYKYNKPSTDPELLHELRQIASGKLKICVPG